MIFFIITTCIFANNKTRNKQYINAITKFINITKDIPNSKIIIVENNGNRETYLNKLGCEVYYTENNKLPTINKGYKELKDIHDCIKTYNINDTDFIVKVSGRYIIHDDSEFINVVKTIDNNIHCIIKYGAYFKPQNIKIEDCITGLIGMRCDYVKQIKLPEEYQPVEHNWAKVTYLINDENIYKVNKLGIDICTHSNSYYAV